MEIEIELYLIKYDMKNRNCQEANSTSILDRQIITCFPVVLLVLPLFGYFPTDLDT